MPANTRKVDRSTRWGNPFSAADAESMAAAVAPHSRWMRGEIEAPDGAEPPSAAELQRALGGCHLACWCPLDGPCHAVLLLAIANAH